MSEEKKSISSLMVENRTFPPSEEVRKRAYIKSFDEYYQMWKHSIDDCENFWLEQAKTLSWFKKTTKDIRIHMEHRRTDYTPYMVC
jgi:acetyl-CoA synthetase